MIKTMITTIWRGSWGDNDGDDDDVKPCEACGGDNDHSDDNLNDQDDNGDGNRADDDPDDQDDDHYNLARLVG